MSRIHRVRALALASLVVNTVALSWTSAARADDPAAGCTTTDDGQETCVFAYTGAPQTWTAPQGATPSSFYVAGAQGGAGGFARGGFGGWAYANASVTPGTVMQINVGGRGGDAPAGSAGGWNGGGAGYNLAGGGGGASDVRQGACAASSSCAMSDRVIVGGAGGGSAGIDTLQQAHYGGEGGGSLGVGGDGYPASTSTYNGGGSKLAYAGAGGQSLCASGSSSSGGTGVGGAGNPACSGGGGGGAGYYGGGGGGSSNSPTYPGGFAGGGGRAWVDPAIPDAHFSDLVPEHVRSGDGVVIIVTPVKAPIVAVAFGKPAADVLENVTLTFTFTNPNPRAPLTNVIILDTYPAGLTNVSPDDFFHDCNGAAISAPLGAGYFSFNGGMIPPGGVCTVVRTVRASKAGIFLNDTGTVTSDQLSGNTANASLQVGANAFSLPPSASMSFSQSSAEIGEDVTLKVTVANPNPDISLTHVVFYDHYPPGLYTVNSALTQNCNTGAVSSQNYYLSMAGGTIAPSGTCTFSVLIRGVIAGNYVSTADAVTADYVSAGNAASALFTVLNPGDHIFSASMETPP